MSKPVFVEREWTCFFYISTLTTRRGVVRKECDSNYVSKEIGVHRSAKFKILLVKLLGKMDLVGKNVSKRRKKVYFGWSVVILTFLLTDVILS
jgi:hypothetical protein